MFHGFHDNRHIDFCLHLQVEARLAHITLLVRAEDLLAFEGTNINTETQRGHLFVELLAMPDGGFSSFGRHVVFVVEVRICQLLHVLNDD